MKSLKRELEVTNTKIKMINKGYINAKKVEEERAYTRDLIESLNAVNALLDSYVRFLGIPYELIPEEAVIDAFITYNSFGVETTVTPPANTTIYPLVFPYSAVRGPRREINQFFTDHLGKAATALISFILGNEPINIRPWKFKTTSILKPSAGPDGTGTLIGIIDTGIDYTNPAFIDSNGDTRIVSIWDQVIGVDSPYGYGTVYDTETINTALKSPDPFEVVPHKDEWGHGTILAGIAAGSGSYENGNYRGAAPGAKLVIVKLRPANDIMQTLYHGNYNPLGFTTVDVALAFEYMVNLANQLQKPISICLPSGTNSGSHDGTNILDSIIASYSSNPGICTVISVGEEANKEHHASGDLKEAREQEIKLTIAKDEGGFMAEIWAMFGDQIEVLLTPPKTGEEILDDILLNQNETYKVAENSYVWTDGMRFDVDTGAQMIRFRFENPIAGEWIIKVRGIVVTEGLYNIWIPKTGMILPGTVLSPASPFTTIYNTSTGEGIISIGCYDKRSLTACTSSGRGFTRNNGVSPDYIVDGVDVPGPLPNNNWGMITGTAPAGAITAGITSLIYENQLAQEEELANTVVMKAILASKVKREPTVLYPNPSTGYGVIDINSDLF